MPKAKPTYVRTTGLTQQIREALKDNQWMSARSICLLVNVSPEAAARHTLQQRSYSTTKARGGGKAAIVSGLVACIARQGQLDRRLQANGKYEYKLNDKGLALLNKHMESKTQN